MDASLISGGTKNTKKISPSFRTYRTNIYVVYTSTRIEEQTIQWPQEKVQKDKQRSIKHTQKTKDRVTQTPLKTGGDLKSFGRISSSCSTSGTHRVNLDLNV
jgi:hypothetical protein